MSVPKKVDDLLSEFSDRSHILKKHIDELTGNVEFTTGSSSFLKSQELSIFVEPEHQKDGSYNAMVTLISSEKDDDLSGFRFSLSFTGKDLPAVNGVTDLRGQIIFRELPASSFLLTHQTIIKKRASLCDTSDVPSDSSDERLEEEILRKSIQMLNEDAFREQHQRMEPYENESLDC